MLTYFIEKGVTVKQRFASVYKVQKSNLTLVRAVAFLMSFISFGLSNTDYRDDDADSKAKSYLIPFLLAIKLTSSVFQCSPRSSPVMVPIPFSCRTTESPSVSATRKIMQACPFF